MAEPEWMVFEKKKLKNPVAIVGFPTVGLVGSILAGLIIRETKIEIVAGITHEDFPPYQFVFDSYPYQQIRVHAGKPVAKKKTKSSSASTQDLIVVTSEIAPKPEDTVKISKLLLEHLKEMGVKDMVCLEGIAGADPNGPIAGVTYDADCKKKFKKIGIQSMETGIVRGITGTMLLHGSYEGMNVIGLMVPANVQFPDPRAAQKLMEPISKLYPFIQVNTSPLSKEAEEIENKIRAQQSKELQDQNGFYG